jgi:uncharacterized protein (TIGR04255 family)
MANERLKLPTLFEASLDVKWVEPILVEQLIIKLESSRDYADFKLERLANPYASSDEGYRERPTHAFSLVSDDYKIPRRIMYLSDTSLSYRANFPPHPNWAGLLKPDYDNLVSLIFNSFQNMEIESLALRFANAFTVSGHLIDSIQNLNLSISVSGVALEKDVGVSYISHRDGCEAIVRILSGSTIVETPTPDLSVLVEIYVTAGLREPIGLKSEVKQWIARAHDFATHEYFRLFTEDMKRRLLVTPNDSSASN